MASIELKNIEKSFGTNKVINKFDIKINDGEFIVLVGPSGCGKSTLLRMISGLESVDTGEIYLDNKLINNLIPSKREIAMVFQSYALYPHMNVFENMSFLRAINILINYFCSSSCEALLLLLMELI